MEMLYRCFIDHNPDGIAVSNAQGLICLVNENLCRMLGYSADELINASIVDFVHPDDGELAARHCGELLSGKLEHCKVRLRLVGKDGKVLTCVVEGTPIYDIVGNTIGFTFIIHDITDQVIAEAETMRLLNMTLARAQLLSVAFEATMQELDVCAERILQAVMDLLNADCGFILLMDNGKPQLVAWRNINQLLRRKLPSFHHLPSWMSNPTTLREDESWRIGILKWLRDDGYRSFISVPLKLDGDWIGVITAASSSRSALSGEEY